MGSLRCSSDAPFPTALLLLRSLACAARQGAPIRLELLRQQIASGALSFEQAVEQHSAGSKRDGGDLGFIHRHGSMPEPFCAAAFALEPGQVSRPVQSPFGVHLIRCREIKPGDKTLEDKDVRRAVELAAAQELFETLAAAQRRAAEIRYTGAMPHYKPGTRELVTP